MLNRDIPLKYHIDFCNKLLNLVKMVEDDHENLSIFCATVDLSRVRRTIESEISDCIKDDNPNSIK